MISDDVPLKMEVGPDHAGLAIYRGGVHLLSIDWEQTVYLFKFLEAVTEANSMFGHRPDMQISINEMP